MTRGFRVRETWPRRPRKKAPIAYKPYGKIPMRTENNPVVKISFRNQEKKEDSNRPIDHAELMKLKGKTVRVSYLNKKGTYGTHTGILEGVGHGLVFINHNYRIEYRIKINRITGITEIK